MFVTEDCHSSAMARPLLSSHHCLGGWDAGADASTGGIDLGSIDAPLAQLTRNQKERTCLFRNVCYDARVQSWVYYTQREFRGRQRVRAGVDVWARGAFGHAQDISEDHRFLINRSSVPSSAAWIKTETVVKIAALAPANFGHFLGNALYPAFVAVWRLFGAAAWSLPLQLVFAGANQSDVNQMRGRCMRWAQQESHSQGSSSMDERASSRCHVHAALVAKFASGLLPGCAPSRAM